MSSIHGLREFVNERLTSAAEEIFRVFEQTVVEYEKEIVRQRRLLDIVLKPEIKLHRTELPLQHVCSRKKKKVLTDQQLCDQETNSSLDQEDLQTPTAAPEEIPRVPQNIVFEFNEDINYQRRLLDPVWKPEIKLHRKDLLQQHICKEEEVLSDQERNTSLDQEDPQPPQIKEEEEELCTSQEGEQLLLKQKNDAVMITPTYEEIDHRWEEPKSGQLLSNNSPVAKSQDHRESIDVYPGSTRDEESKKEKRCHENTSHSDNVDNSSPTKSQCYTHTSKTSLTYETFQRAFQCESELNMHLRNQTGERPYSCITCRKRFCHIKHLQQHIRIHMDEKPYLCETCGKSFKTTIAMLVHARTHKYVKSNTCNTCGKNFSHKSSLEVHKKTHTGEKPHLCKICGKCFLRRDALMFHMMTHTGEKPYFCRDCGKAFRQSGALNVHIRTHTGEKPYSCKTCRRTFTQSSSLQRHIRSHTDSNGKKAI
ncbi:zinc finger protein 558-like [Limanda limanda]|uniref:zinc finger protein 558-like n=1 Tax=Limanda limanda TaxID=27771 RepID=UPI0029C6C71E|nr:zinc finger protein 558-like [Limanda limanda]